LKEKKNKTKNTWQHTKIKNTTQLPRENREKEKAHHFKIDKDQGAQTKTKHTNKKKQENNTNTQILRVKRGHGRKKN